MWLRGRCSSTILSWYVNNNNIQHWKSLCFSEIFSVSCPLLHLAIKKTFILPCFSSLHNKESFHSPTSAKNCGPFKNTEHTNNNHNTTYSFKVTWGTFHVNKLQISISIVYTVIMILMCFGAVYFGKNDFCGVTDSISTTTKLKNMLDHGGYRTYDLW